MPIRILLLDDHALFRESLARLLESEHGLKVVASCATVEEAQLVTSSQPVDLVLLDFDLGQERGSAFVHWAQAAGYPGRILAVTAGLHEADTLELLRSGVAGVFLKHSAPASLIHAIHQVMSGLAWLDQKSVLQIARSAEPTAQDFAPNDLTPRERQVLQAVFEGLSNKEIGYRLGVSETSVKATLQQLFRKTGVRSRTQLVRIVIDRFGHTWQTR